MPFFGRNRGVRQEKGIFRSKAEDSAEIESFVDVITELNKASRWGRDRRNNNERLTARQVTALRVASARCSIYCFISLTIAVVTTVTVYYISEGSLLLMVPAAVLTFYPAVTLIHYIVREFLTGEGKLWASGAGVVCQGIFYGALIFLFSLAVLTVVCVLCHQLLSTLSSFILRVTNDVVFDVWGTGGTWFGDHVYFLPSVIKTLSALVFEKGFVIALLSFACCLTAVLIPYGIFLFVVWRERRITRIVEELFF